jgi:glycosyltransferase involved in cell wall biosynthesis
MTMLGLIVLAGAAMAAGLVAWNTLAWPRLRPAGDAEQRGIAVLIPARDEAERIGPCLDAVLAQGDAVAEILVYDDHSMDGTAAVVAEYAQQDSRIRAVPPEPLPPGWCGKNFACARLAAAAAAPWLLFLDADARLEPRAAARMVAEAETRRLTFLSCWPGLDMRGFWEHALMPLLNFSVLTLFPAPLALRRNTPALGLAHGACILVQRDAYEAVGGHEAVRGELFEDTCLARHWRAQGARSACLDGQDIVRVRMYNSLAAIWNGFRKNFYPAFRRRASFWLFLAIHALVFVLPFVAAPAVWWHGGVSWPWWSAAGCVLLARAMLAARFHWAWWPIPVHPIAHAMMLALAVASWWRCASGHGVEWKGRQYRTSGASR